MSLFGRSRVRDRILLEFFARPGTSVHVREMARRVKASAPTVGAELAELARLGVLQANPVRRSLVYSVNERSPLLAEIRALVQKTIGVEGLIAKAVERSSTKASALIEDARRALATCRSIVGKDPKSAVLLAWDGVAFTTFTAALALAGYRVTNRMGHHRAAVDASRHLLGEDALM